MRHPFVVLGVVGGLVLAAPLPGGGQERFFYPVLDVLSPIGSQEVLGRTPVRRWPPQAAEAGSGGRTLQKGRAQLGRRDLEVVRDG